MLNPALHARLIACGTHILVSLAFAAATTGLILCLWFPSPYAKLSGGLELLWLLISVDVIVGPLLTLVVFNVAKPRSELVRDLCIISALQLAALAYGLYTIAAARPVALVFEQDRFRVVAANDVLEAELPEALPPFRSLSLRGPVSIGSRSVRSSDEKLKALDLALKGYDIGQRPSFWVPYDQTRAQALAMSRPVTVLLQHYPKETPSIQAELDALHAPIENTRFLPVQTKKGTWVVLINGEGTVVGFLAQDGFF